MNLKRAGAALTAATALVLGIATPTTAVYLPKPKRFAATAVDYGSGLWGGPIGSPTESGDLATADVAMYGDSITSRCRTDIAAALAAKNRTLYTWAWSGQNTHGIAAAIQAADQVAPWTIVEAGTNDVFDPFTARADITNLAAYLDVSGREWRWMDTYVGRATTALDDIRNSGQVNGLIHSAAGEDRIVRWVDALTAARGRGRALSYYLQDGVHPWVAAGTGHGDGCAFLAAVVAAAIPGATP